MAPRGGAHLVAVDLYCGGGGSSAGLAMAGIDVALGIDKNPAARACFSRLHRMAACEDVDCGDLDAVVAAVRKALGPLRRPDILTASPPCTPWSTASRPAAHHAVAAAQLQYTADTICALQPRVAIIENVPSARSTPQWAAMRATLRLGGYNLEEAVVDAAKLGVPQRRRRVFLVATAGGGHTGFEEAAA